MFNSKNHLAFSAGLVVLLASTLNATTPVVITSTYITYSTNVLTVYGSGFSTGATPTFIFNGKVLTVKGFTNTSVTATMRSGTNQGTYQVVIRNSQGQSATTTTFWDAEGLDADTIITNSTLKGSGTKSSPLGVKTPLTLNSPGTGITPLTLGHTDDSNGLDPGVAVALPYGGIKIQEGFIDVTSLYLNVFSALTTHGVYAVSAYGPTGVYGGACCDDTQASTGIYGTDSGYSSASAGYFNGNVDITGKLTKAGGSFKIDHPLDPANKYLSHSFVESPDMKNIYDGTVVTDGTGNATVTLPDWFEALNRDFRYQLTVIGQFAQAVISQEVTHNQFIIRTDKANVKVSWQVTGIRQDAWANAHRIPVEEDKLEKEREFYLHPELFNQPPQKNVEWVRHPDIMKKHAEMMQKAAAALHATK
jgi:hypothetical protein